MFAKPTSFDVLAILALIAMSRMIARKSALILVGTAARVVPATALPNPLRRLSCPSSTWPMPLALNSALRTTLPSARYS
ncbi:hypothetical protein D3C78_1663040 [compost metagenome]